MYRGSKCSVIDNSGAKAVRVIRSSLRFKPINLGSVILVSILRRDFMRRRIRLGQVFRAIIIGRGFNTTRVLGHSIHFSNVVILLKRTDVVPISKRIKGPVPLEFRKLKFAKLMSMGLYVYLKN